MSATVIPYPLMKRRHWIERQIGNVAHYHADAAERYLAQRIADRVMSLRRAGVADDLIAADVEPVREIFLNYLSASNKRVG
jgi:Family of unknown function (DUF6074)